MNAIELWTKACEHLRSVLSNDAYSRWIENIVPGTIQDGHFILHADNTICKAFIEENFKDSIINALRAAGMPTELGIRFTDQSFDQPADEDGSGKPELPEPKPEPKPVPVPKRRQKMNSNGLTNPLNPKFTFDDFVIGPSNSFAHAAALGVSQSPGKAYNPLFIYGQTGIGKTHLMQAVGHQVLKSPGKSVSYVSSETLLNEYVESLQKRTTVEFRNKYRNTDVLLVDDIQFLAGKDRLQDEFFHTFNVLYDAHKQIIMTSDLPPQKTGLEPRLVSRFEWGLVTEIESTDFETRLAILKYKQHSRNVTLPDDVLTFIATNITSNVRSLEGALTRATSYAALHKSAPLTLDILRNLLKDQLNEERQKDISFDDIQSVVAAHFHLRMMDMSSKQRPRSVATPRQVAMFLCRKLTHLSLQEIAKPFKKEYPTVIYACKTIQGRIQVDEELRNAVREIIRKLGRDPQMFQI
jgi:chromosomal replication initiator protein DnaA